MLHQCALQRNHGLLKCADAVADLFKFQCHMLRSTVLRSETTARSTFQRVRTSPTALRSHASALGGDGRSVDATFYPAAGAHWDLTATFL